MNDQQNAFLRMAVPAAQAAWRKWDVPASVTIAQAILESGWGRSQLTRQANNFFGIKAAAGAAPESYVEFPTREFEDGEPVQVQARFAKYSSAAESFEAHAELLATARRYRNAMAVRYDPEHFAIELQQCGYSTNPGYGVLLWKLICDYDLTQYDCPPDPAQAQEVAA